MNPPPCQFLKTAGRILNSGQAQAIVLTGNIHDLFCLPGEAAADYVPLTAFLAASWRLPNILLATYEINGPVRFVREEDATTMRDAWLRWRTGMDSNQLDIQRMLSPEQTAARLEEARTVYDESFRGAVGNPTLALELLRQMCQCSRTVINGRRLLAGNLLILIEGADLLMPEAPVPSLSDSDRHRVGICQDWFSDPGFLNGRDGVVLMAESRSQIHHRIARLPQLLEVQIPSPDQPARLHFIETFNQQRSAEARAALWAGPEDLARYTAGLSIHALRQLLMAAAHERKALQPQDVVAKVEEFIQSQLGEDIVEFKKPSHTLNDVMGFTRLKGFLKDELIPRLQNAGPDCISGAAVCGPIGGGKTFIFEALAAELDMVVLVLKNLRSQWFGQTDVIFERLKRVLDALSRVLIFVDEADTQFGGVGADTHETERRLTGKLQALMSDPVMRGRVIWLLITARIHLLSPDLRRPGRVGDLIIPTLDPEGADRETFLRWAVKPALEGALSDEALQRLDGPTKHYSAAAFSALRAELKAKVRRAGKPLDFEAVAAVVADQLPPAIQETRRYQTLQALVNCTRRSLLPDPNVTDEQRGLWERELRQLEAKGIR